MKLLSIALLCTSLSAFAAEVSVPSSRIEFSVNKDVEVTSAQLGISCLRRATFFEQLNNGMDEHAVCDDFKINGQGQYLGGASINLKKVGKNKFVLESDVEVSFSTRRKGHVCLVIDPRIDADVRFKNPYDEYSVLSFCTMDKLPIKLNEYIYNNRRVSELEDFKEALGRPLQIDLK